MAIARSLPSVRFRGSRGEMSVCCAAVLISLSTCLLCCVTFLLSLGMVSVDGHLFIARRATEQRPVYKQAGIVSLRDAALASTIVCCQD